MGNWWTWLRRTPSDSGRMQRSDDDTADERFLLLDYEHKQSESGGSVVAEEVYAFTVRDKCLSGPPPNWGRWRKSLLLDFIGKKLGGNFCHEPEDMMNSPSSPDDTPVCNLSDSTQTILKKVFEDLDPQEVVDYHMHLVGHGDSGSGCHLHDSTKSWWYPVNRIKAAVFMSAAQVPDMEGGDVQFISRLIRLVKHFMPASVLDPSQHGYLHGKFCLLAFDEFYEKDGQRNRPNTTLYIPNDYAFVLAKEFPEYFYAIGSINPYRADALDELERCAENGVTIIKWLPNSMGIDPSDEECVPFYEKMKKLDMALLVHSGHEHSVDAAFIDNRLGNPLLLRKPLDCGVKVIAAHCATEGHAPDSDNDGALVSCFDLFLRLMREDKYKDLLFGDISAVCAFRRVPQLIALLQATDIHSRLVYGSDYPVPAINLVVHTSKLKRYDMITEEECNALNELYNYNSLLFDIASKRLLQGPNGERFPPSVFKAHPNLPPYRPHEPVQPVEPVALVPH